MEAFRSRNELLQLTSRLLISNMELARRIALLEDCFDTSDAVTSRRPDSLAATRNPQQRSANTRLQENNDALSVLTQDVTTLFDSRNAFTMNTGPTTALHFEFEAILFASRVYHSVTRQNSDISFRSSVGLSHAWTAISDMSLSDISSLSVIALPLICEDLSNQQHYTFRHYSDIVEQVRELKTTFRPRLPRPRIANIAPVRLVSLDFGLEADSGQEIVRHGDLAHPAVSRVSLLIKGGGSSARFGYMQKVSNSSDGRHLQSRTLR